MKSSVRLASCSRTVTFLFGVDDLVNADGGCSQLMPSNRFNVIRPPQDHVIPMDFASLVTSKVV